MIIVVKSKSNSYLISLSELVKTTGKNDRKVIFFTVVGIFTSIYLNNPKESSI